LINEGAKRTKSVFNVSKKIKNIFLLTGTPVVNYVSELISLLKILGTLWQFGGKVNYQFKYCDPKTGYMNKLDLSGAKNVDDLNTNLRSICYIRRLKRDVLQELPEKTRTIIRLELSNSSEYVKAENDIKKWLKDHIEEKYVNKINDMSDEEADGFISNEEERIDKMDFGIHLVKIETLKQLSAAGKLEGVFEWIDNFLMSGEKLILFASHIKILQILHAKYPKAVTIFSENTDEEKRDNKKRFNEDPNCQLIICAMGTSAVNSPGGIGHNLTSASNVAFLEFGWNPSVHDQAEDRAHRIGQKNAVNCWYFVGNGSIDEKIIHLIEEKRAIINAAANDGIVRNVNIASELIRSLIE
jgi:SWI/SNF-related matrix-associated actin-dependent regulator 1 of chromatin subfamily A